MMKLQQILSIKKKIVSAVYKIDYPDLPITFLHKPQIQIYYSLQQQKVKSIKRSTTITELVVVWSLCSVCTSVTKSKAVILYNTSRFLL